MQVRKRSCETALHVTEPGRGELRRQLRMSKGCCLACDRVLVRDRRYPGVDTMQHGRRSRRVSQALEVGNPNRRATAAAHVCDLTQRGAASIEVRQLVQYPHA